ncbi:hypothetical protein SAMN04490248_10912 [Salinihabitans flavidus]|uniref:Uncharacterized protein n=1 Tax=Salinihabitans flavidus TaxID=569882 RepID=A0A1H8RJU0_9RHOB|nr:DUF6152 family protein [Salinihabitans flavidus]SEO66809.1 hypothetical protein SAMN04490248_10912 [Salinihabitans flavidus]
MLTRRTLTFAILVGGFATPVLAHHGWRWTSGDNIRLTGIIQSARLGNPHGVLQVDADGEVWQVEVGQPWRNERAGLTDDDFAEGREIVIEGEPSTDVEERLLKAERIWFDDNLHDLYPGRS